MSILDKLKQRNEQPNRQSEAGIVNPANNGSLLFDRAGNVTIAASSNVQYKMNAGQGAVSEVSFHSVSIANRKELKVDEIIVNNHKLNPQIYDLTDMKQLFNDPTLAIGNLTVNATVLVKAWEPTLERWVLVRRPMRTPLFMNAMGVAGAPGEMDIDDNISSELEQIEERM